MKTNLFSSIRKQVAKLTTPLALWRGVGGEALLLLAFFTACSDTWDDHYDASAIATGMNEGSLWQAIQQNPELSNFAKVLQATGYDKQLSGSQVFTVFAPTNVSLSADDAQSLISKYQQQILTKSDDDNEVLKEFIKNHIALYNHSVSSASNDSVVLMNGKNVVLKSDKVGGASLLSSNKLYQNGVLFTIGSKLNYLSNVFEYIEKDPDLDSLRSFLYNQDQYKFYYREFMPSLSVVDSVKDGQTVYMDSVFRQRNRLFTELDFINEEDSTFWMVAPTNAVWKELIDEYSNYFKYPKNVEYADSMAYTNARLAIVQGTIFSKTTNRSVFENQTSSLTQVSDSAMSENAVLDYQRRSRLWGANFNYYEYLNAWAPGGVFSQTDLVECSNGMVRKATQWPIDKLQTFLRYRIIEAEGDDILEVSKITDAKGDSITTVTPIVRTVSTTDVTKNFENKVWNKQFVEFSPTEATVNHSVTYGIKDVLSEVGYDIYLVTAPAIAYNPNATDTLPTLMRTTLSYPTLEGKIQSKTFDNVTTTPNKMDYFLLAEDFKFPATNYDLDQDRPSVQLKIETRVSNGNVRDGKYTRTMRIDCILLVPHGTLDLTNEGYVRLLPHGTYNDTYLRWWLMER
jgi:uncharacterized surface protein with fasciclin (FAS1) repeats